MEVMVTFTDGHESSGEVIPWRVLVIKGSLSKPMRKRVDAKGRVMDENETKDTRIDVSSTSVSPQKPGKNRGYDEAHEENQLEIMPVLPPHYLVLAQIADVRHTRPTARLQEHPSYMRVPETLMGVVRVEVGVGIAMVCPVTSRPPLDRAFDSTGSRKGKIILQRNRCIVRPMCPKPVVPCGDAEPSDEIPKNGKNEGLPSKRGQKRANGANNGGKTENGNVEPIQIVAPV